MPVLDEVFVRLGFRGSDAAADAKASAKKITDALKKIRDGVKKTGDSGKQLKKASKGVSDLSKSFNKLLPKLIAVTAAYFSFRTVIDSIERTNLLGKTAEKIGTTTDALQQMRFAAEQNGISVVNFDRGLQRMVRRLSEVEGTTGPVNQVIRDLGVNFDELKAAAPEDQMAMIADGMEGMSSQSEKVAAAFALFDTEGVDMVRMLGNGSEAMKKLMADGKALGLTLTNDQVAAVERVKEAWIRLDTTAKAAMDKIIVTAGPLMETALNNLVISSVAVSGALESAFGGEKVSRAQALTNEVNKAATAFNHINNIMKEDIAEGGSDDTVDILQEQEEAARELITRLKDLAEVRKEAQIGRFELDPSKPIAVADSFNIVGTALKSLGAELDIVDKKLEEDKGDGPYDGQIAQVIKLGVALKSLEDQYKGVQSSSEKAFVPPETALEAAKKRYRKFYAEVNAETVNSDEQAKFRRSRNLTDWEDIQAASLETRKTALQASTMEQLSQQQFMADNEKQIIENKVLAIKNAETDAALAVAATWESGARGKMKIIGGILSTLGTLMQSENRKAFEIGKAASYAATVVNTAEAAMGAYTAMAKIPVVGPALGVAAAGAAVAAGAIQMQTISNTQFKGGGSVTKPSAAADTGATAGAAPEVNQSTFNINLQGENFTGESVRGLIGAIGEQVDDGTTFNTEITT